MNRKLVISFLVILVAIALLVGACAGPPISHPVDGRTDCLSCHAKNSSNPYPGFHEREGFGNNDCLRCHTAKS